MQSLTYTDIIEEKIAEWLDKLKKLEQRAGRASADSEVRSTTRMNELKSAIDAATGQLHALNAQENVDNTMETKDKIVKIFGTVDKEFSEFKDKTPFML